MMSEAPPTALEQVFRRHRDDLYRIALLIYGAPDLAGQVVAQVARRLMVAPPDEPVLSDIVAQLANYLAESPPRRASKTLPPWIQQAPLEPRERQVLQLINQLSVDEKLAFGVRLVIGATLGEVAQLLGRDQAEVAALLTNGCRHLAPVVPDIAAEVLESPTQPSCQQARMFLIQGDAQIAPELRSHIVLCPECQAAAQALRQIERQAELALRTALRPQRLPAAADAVVQAVFHPVTVQPVARQVAGRPSWQWLIGVCLLVGLAGGVLLWQRPFTTITSSGQLVERVDAQALLTKAQQQLYQAPSNISLWHGTWEIFWPFENGTSTYLTAEIWRDANRSRHRLQLAHVQGGGFYEFQLADGEGRVWYHVDTTYAPSLYPQSDSWRSGSVAFSNLSPETQQQLVQARLASGAWGIAGRYLEQARQADDLRTWGFRTADDGTPLVILGYQAASPLGPPVNADASEPFPATILLVIDRQSGVLREISELVGPSEGERRGQVVWRFVKGEIVSSGAAAQVLGLKDSWSRQQYFAGQPSLTHPLLPTIRERIVDPLAVALQNPWVILPTQVPDGMETAVLMLRRANVPIATAVYVGGYRRLVVQSISAEVRDPMAILPANCQLELLDLELRSIRLCPQPGFGYEALITRISGMPDVAVRLSARGFSRAELIPLLRQADSLSIGQFREQVRLFVDPTQNAAEVQSTLVAALAEPSPPANNEVRQISYTRFQRQGDFGLNLTDPYHADLYLGLPETLQGEVWLAYRGQELRRRQDVLRDPQGALVWLNEWQPRATTIYEPRQERLMVSSQPTVGAITPIQRLVTQLLRCSGVTIQTEADGTRWVSLRERDWIGRSCIRPQYGTLYRNQTNLMNGVMIIGDRFRVEPDAGPFLADISYAQAVMAVMETKIRVTAEGQADLAEIRLLLPERELLLEQWQLGEQRVLPLSQQPADLLPTSSFREGVPSLIRIDYTVLHQPPHSDIGFASRSLSETLQQWYKPFYSFRTGEGVERQSFDMALPEHNTAAVGLLGNPIGDSLVYGVTVRQKFVIKQGPREQMIYLYQGDELFRRFLQAQAHWVRSEPIRITVNGKPVDGWQVTSDGVNVWWLFEQDSTLLAVSLSRDTDWLLAERLINLSSQ